MSTTTTAAPAKKGSGRLLALDILRGITIAGMILVNNPGSWGNIYAPLKHASWHGLTPTDLVFPFFMFIMGISTYMSLRKYDFTFSWASFVKIVRRTIVIFLIGLAIAWFGMFLRGILNDATLWEAVFNFDHIRILGVMPRLAICYGVGASMALLIKRDALPWVVAGMLVVYTLLLIFGNGFAFADSNIISIVDHKVLGPDHMYADTIDGVRLKFDPEGLLSTLPSIAHMLIGFICGGLIMRQKTTTCASTAFSSWAQSSPSPASCYPTAALSTKKSGRRHSCSPPAAWPPRSLACSYGLSTSRATNAGADSSRPSASIHCSCTALELCFLSSSAHSGFRSTTVQSQSKVGFITNSSLLCVQAMQPLPRSYLQFHSYCLTGV